MKDAYDVAMEIEQDISDRGDFFYDIDADVKFNMLREWSNIIAKAQREAHAAGRREGIEAAADLGDSHRRKHDRNTAQHADDGDLESKWSSMDCSGAVAALTDAIRALSAQPTEETK